MRFATYRRLMHSGYTVDGENDIVLVFIEASLVCTFDRVVHAEESCVVINNTVKVEPPYICKLTEQNCLTNYEIFTIFFGWISIINP